MSASIRVIIGLALCAAAGACARNVTIGRLQEPSEISDVQASIQPTVRTVPDADIELLWKSSDEFVSRTWVRDGIDIRDPRKRVIETHTSEWIEAGLPHRTRVTVEVRPEPRHQHNAELLVVALRIEPQLDIPDTGDAEPPAMQWMLIGKNEKIEEMVAEQIMRRYLLYRQGRNPDDVPPEEKPAGYDGSRKR